MRLIGLPGEQVRIAGGDLFVDGRRLHKPANLLWLPVHDTRLVAPHDTTRTPRWRAADSASAWTVDDRGGWQFNDSGGAWNSLDFSAPLTDRSDHAPKIRSDDGHALDEGVTELPTGDVRWDADVAAFPASAELRLQCEFRGRIVDVRIVGDGSVTISRDSGRSATGRLRGGLEGALSIAMRDGEAAVFHQGDQIAALDLNTAPAIVENDSGSIEAGDPAQDGARVQLQARGETIAFSRLRLFRDVYYRDLSELFPDGSAARLRNASDEFTLSPDHYLVLGDHSARSSDSRFYGAVEHAGLIGVVRCIYWPPARWTVFR
jgi:signal peptidase I